MWTKYFYFNRTKRIVNFLLPYIPKSNSILDVGAGTMEIADGLDKKGLRVTGIDVIDINMTKLPFKKFNGIKIPYPDKSFDVVMLVFVLHHMKMEDQSKLLIECRRVARNRVLVAEDVFNNYFEKLITILLDKSNWFLAHDMPIPCTFRKEQDWIKLFEKLRFKKIKKFVVRPNSARPTRHRLFVLEKSN